MRSLKRQRGLLSMVFYALIGIAALVAGYFAYFAWHEVVANRYREEGRSEVREQLEPKIMTLTQERDAMRTDISHMDEANKMLQAHVNDLQDRVRNQTDSIHRYQAAAKGRGCP